MNHNAKDKIIFWGSFIALITTSMAFIIRAILINSGIWPDQFGLDKVESGILFGAGIWPFAISIIVFSLIIDRVGNHILIFVASGRGWLQLSGRHSLRRGDLILIPPGQVHAYGADAEDPWEIYWLHFDGRGAQALLEWTQFSEKTPTLSTPRIDSLRRHFHTALTAVERGYSDHTLLELSRALINVLTVLHSNQPGQDHKRESQRIERVMDSLRNNLHAPKPLKHYAREAGLSVSRFSESFKKHCGVSPMTYFTELRIQRACELLDRSDLQVGEIAEKLGFADRLYFTRLFSKHTGMPPTAYRQRRIG